MSVGRAVSYLGLYINFTKFLWNFHLNFCNQKIPWKCTSLCAMDPLSVRRTKKSADFHPQADASAARTSLVWPCRQLSGSLERLSPAAKDRKVIMVLKTASPSPCSTVGHFCLVRRFSYVCWRAQLWAYLSCEGHVVVHSSVMHWHQLLLLLLLTQYNYVMWLDTEIRHENVSWESVDLTDNVSARNVEFFCFAGLRLTTSTELLLRLTSPYCSRYMCKTEWHDDRTYLGQQDWQELYTVLMILFDIFDIK